MMFCPRCGIENMNGATFCQKCGMMLNAPKNMIGTGAEWCKACVVFLVVFFVVVGGVWYYNESTHGNHAYVEVRVHSSHITETVDVQILFDDEIAYTWTDLKPGNTFYSKNYHTVYFSKFDSSYIVTVKAISTGGATGKVTDVKELIIQPDQKYTVDLYI